MANLEVQPFDVHNRMLVGNVHPPDWQNPEPAPRYNLVVIGAGAAGLITAAGAAGLGARVALVEREFMGGDCLNVGCVPSKALIRAARAAAAVRDAQTFGVVVPPGTRVDFSAVMERMRRLRAAISRNDSVERYSRMGVDVFLGHGRFSGPDSVEVDGKTLRFRQAVIATGARAGKLPIPGLTDGDYLTNETVFSLTELPPRLAVIGAGPVGCELAQSFARFGSQVTLLEVAPHILPTEDPDAAALVEKALIRDGVSVLVNTTITMVETQGTEKILRYHRDGKEGTVRIDRVLLGVGRMPNVDGLNLEGAGVEYSAKEGVKVNDRLQTSNRRIFAAGDICHRWKFTHMAEAMARIVIQNALFAGRASASTLTVPWVTYTDPEVAHVGIHEREAREQGIGIDTFVQPFHEVDRAILDGDAGGFVKIHVKSGTDQIVGATIVAGHAGEMISEITLAMVGKLGLKTIARTIHPYPTQAEGIKRCADAYNRTRLTPAVKWLFQKWLAWTR